MKLQFSRSLWNSKKARKAEQKQFRKSDKAKAIKDSIDCKAGR